MGQKFTKSEIDQITMDVTNTRIKLQSMCYKMCGCRQGTVTFNTPVEISPHFNYDTTIDKMTVTYNRDAPVGDIDIVFQINAHHTADTITLNVHIDDMSPRNLLKIVQCTDIVAKPSKPTQVNYLDDIIGIRTKILQDISDLLVAIRPENQSDVEIEIEFNKRFRLSCGKYCEGVSMVDYCIYAEILASDVPLDYDELSIIDLNDILQAIYSYK